MRFTWSLALALALTLGAGHARAERVDEKTVKSWIKRGESLFRAGRLEMALMMFRKAEPHSALIKDHAGVRWNIARCHEELKQYPEAVEAFEAYLEVERSRAGRKDGRAKVDELFPKAYGQMEIECVDRLKIHLEHKGKESTHNCPGRWVRLRAGRYRFWAEVSGRLYEPQDVLIQVGKVSRFKIPAPGFLTIDTTSQGGERVRLNGDELGALPLEQRALPPGPYRVEIIHPDHPPWRRDINVEADEESRILYKAPEASQAAGTSWQPWVYGGGAAASFIAGGALLWSASSNAQVADDNYANYLKARRPEDAKLLREAVDGATEKAEQQQLVGWIAIGVGGALSALTLWSLTVDAPVAVLPQEGGGVISWGASW